MIADIARTTEEVHHDKHYQQPPSSRPVCPNRHPQETPFFSLAVEAVAALVSTALILSFIGGFAYLLYLLFLKELG